MADELPEVEQRFRADLADYVEPIKAAAEETQSFADKNVEAAGAVEDLDHELHDQTESYFALAAAIDAAAGSYDDLAASQKLAGSDASGLENTLKTLRDELGDMALGDSLTVGKDGLNSFSFAVEDADTKMQRMKLDAEDLGREIKRTGLDADEAFTAGRSAIDDYKKSLDGLRAAVVGMYAGEDLAQAAAGGAGGAGEAGGGFAGATAMLAADPPELFALAAGALVLAPVIAAIIQETGLLITGFIAAGAGVAAFAALAIPTFDKIKNSYEGIVTAQKTYRAAAQLEARDPSTQNLAAEKTALAQLQIAWADVPKAIRPAVGELFDLKSTYDKLVKSFEPTAIKTFTLALKGVNELLPNLKPLADIAGAAINGLLGHFDKFLGSSGFKTWLGQFDKISGPAITAIGQGIGEVAVNFGKLMTALPKQDVANAINIFFRIISGSLRGIADAARNVAHDWDWLSRTSVDTWHAMEAAWRQGSRVIEDIGNVITYVADDIGSKIEHAFDKVNSVIDTSTHDAINWVRQMASDVENDVSEMGDRVILDWDHAWNSVIAFAGRVPGDILRALGNLGSLLVEAGRALVSGLIAGISAMIGPLESVIGTIRRLMDDVGGFFSGGSPGSSAAAAAGAAALGGVGGTHGGSGSAHTVNVTVRNGMTSAAYEQGLQRHVQNAVLTYAKTNAGSLLTLPGRRS